MLGIIGNSKGVALKMLIWGTLDLQRRPVEAPRAGRVAPERGLCCQHRRGLGHRVVPIWVKIALLMLILIIVCLRREELWTLESLDILVLLEDISGWLVFRGSSWLQRSMEVVGTHLSSTYSFNLPFFVSREVISESKNLSFAAKFIEYAFFGS